MKINPRHLKWRGHTIICIPYGADLTSAPLAGLMDHAGRYSSAKDFKAGAVTYHILEQYMGLNEAQLVLNAGGKVSGFSPYITVTDLSEEVPEGTPLRFHEDGSVKSWEEWAERVLPDIEDGKRYLIAPDVQNDYFNADGVMDVAAFIATGYVLTKRAEWEAAYQVWLTAQPEEEV